MTNPSTTITNPSSSYSSSSAQSESSSSATSVQNKFPPRLRELFNIVKAALNDKVTPTIKASEGAKPADNTANKQNILEEPLTTNVDTLEKFVPYCTICFSLPTSPLIILNAPGPNNTPITKGSGQSYDRHCLERTFKALGKFDPLTRAPVNPESQLKANATLLHAIEELKILQQGDIEAAIELAKCNSIRAMPILLAYANVLRDSLPPEKKAELDIIEKELKKSTRFKPQQLEPRDGSPGWYFGFLCPISRQILVDPVTLNGEISFSQASVNKLLILCAGGRKQESVKSFLHILGISPRELNLLPNLLTPNRFVADAITNLQKIAYSQLNTGSLPNNTACKSESIFAELIQGIYSEGLKEIGWLLNLINETEELVVSYKRNRLPAIKKAEEAEEKAEELAASHKRNRLIVSYSAIILLLIAILYHQRYRLGSAAIAVIIKLLPHLDYLLGSAFLVAIKQFPELHLTISRYVESILIDRIVDDDIASYEWLITFSVFAAEEAKALAIVQPSLLRHKAFEYGAINIATRFLQKNPLVAAFVHLADVIPGFPWREKNMYPSEKIRKLRQENSVKLLQMLLKARIDAKITNRNHYYLNDNHLSILKCIKTNNIAAAQILLDAGAEFNILSYYNIDESHGIFPYPYVEGRRMIDSTYYPIAYLVNQLQNKIRSPQMMHLLVQSLYEKDKEPKYISLLIKDTLWQVGATEALKDFYPPDKHKEFWTKQLGDSAYVEESLPAVANAMQSLHALLTIVAKENDVEAIINDINEEPLSKFIDWHSAKYVNVLAELINFGYRPPYPLDYYVSGGPISYYSPDESILLKAVTLAKQLLAEEPTPQKVAYHNNSIAALREFAIRRGFKNLSIALSQDEIPKISQQIKTMPPPASNPKTTENSLQEDASSGQTTISWDSFNLVQTNSASPRSQGVFGFIGQIYTYVGSFFRRAPSHSLLATTDTIQHLRNSSPDTNDVGSGTQDIAPTVKPVSTFTTPLTGLDALTLLANNKTLLAGIGNLSYSLTKWFRPGEIVRQLSMQEVDLLKEQQCAVEQLGSTLSQQSQNFFCKYTKACDEKLYFAEKIFVRVTDEIAKALISDKASSNQLAKIATDLQRLQQQSSCISERCQNLHPYKAKIKRYLELNDTRRNRTALRDKRLHITFNADNKPVIEWRDYGSYYISSPCFSKVSTSLPRLPIATLFNNKNKALDKTLGEPPKRSTLIE